jgi:hypothetical protein
LPECRKDEAFDDDEFGHRTKRLKIGRRAHPKHGQAVQTEGNAEIISYRDVGVPSVGFELSVSVFASELENKGDESE